MSAQGPESGGVDGNDDIRVVDFGAPPRHSHSSKSLHTKLSDGEEARSGRSTPARYYRQRQSRAQKLMTKVKARVKRITNGPKLTSLSLVGGQTASSSFDEQLDKEAPALDTSYLAKERPAIKIRIATFNMASSLPSRSGDLSEFLGQLDQPEATNGLRTSKSFSTTASAAASTRASLDKGDGLSQYPLDSGHPYHILVVGGQECPTASGVLQGHVSRWSGKGWTYRLEKYLCGGSSTGDETTDEDEPEEGVPADDTASIKSYVAGKKARGPYVLVEKERLMGIYIAVFVRRECEHFIQNVAKARVTAGLIGGRVGNKGACAVSLAFAGSRFLFISAHLAAHASALDVRKQNIEKIFQELATLDDFSGRRDQQVQHLSERWDQTFFFGDLNFRLDISRLHADWLLKTRDYPTALAFDQLRKVLQEPKSCLPSFQEGPILFGPTYKYDLAPKSTKRKNLKALKKRAAEKDDAPSSPRSQGATLALSDPEIHKPNGETLSLVSTRDSDLSDMKRDDMSPVDTPPVPWGATGLPTPPLKGGETSLDAMRKAQMKLVKLVRSNSVSPASPQNKQFDTNKPAIRRPLLRSAQTDLVVPQSPKSDQAATIDDQKPEIDLVDAVFDTSSKQRVQSYTDRILFRSTVSGGETSGPSPSQILAPALLDSVRHYRSGRGPAFKESEHDGQEPTFVNPFGPRSDYDQVPGKDDPSPRHAHFGAVDSAPKTTRRISADNVMYRNRPGRSASWRKDHAFKRSRTSSISSAQAADVSRRNDRPFWKRAASSPSPAIKESPSTSGAASPFSKTPVTRVDSAPNVPSTPAPEPTHELQRSRSESTASDQSASNHAWRNVFRTSGPLSRSQTRASGATNAPAFTFKGLRDLLSSIPLPFVTNAAPASRAPSLSEAPVIEKTGPKKGEIQVIEYSSVANLTKMQAISDHRPVFTVVAVGLGEPTK